MALEPIILEIQAHGEDKVMGAFRDIATGATRLGDTVEAASSRANDLDESLRKIKGNQFVEAANRAKDFDDAVGEASARLDGLTNKAERIRNIGAALAVAGAGGVALAATWAERSKEGDNIEQRMEGVLKAQQRLADADPINDVIANVTVKAHLPDDDPVREAVVQMLSDHVSTADISPLLEATVRNAQTVGISVDETGKLFSKAYGTGNMAMLKRANILFTEQEEAAVKAAYAISDVAGRAAFMKAVMASTATSTHALGDGLTESQKAANDAERAYDDMATNMGRGSQMAAAEVKQLGVNILGMVAGNEGAAEKFGWLFTMGSYLASGVGSVVGFVAQIAVLRYSLIATAAAKDAMAAADTAAAVAAAGNAAATTASGVAAAGATVPTTALALADTALADAEFEATLAAWAEADALAVAGGAAALAGTEAAAGAVGFGLLAGAVGLAAVALAGFWVAFQGSKDGQKMSDDELKKKWGSLGSFWSWASGTSRANPETGDNMDGGMNQPDTVASPVVPKLAGMPQGAMAIPGVATIGMPGIAGSSSAASDAKRKVEQAQRAKEKTARLEASVDEASSDAQYQIKLAQLQKSKEGANEAKVRDIEHQIALMEAEKTYHAEMARATGISDPEERKAAMAKANIAYKGSTTAADITYSGAGPSVPGALGSSSFASILASIGARPVVGNETARGGVLYSGYQGRAQSAFSGMAATYGVTRGAASGSMSDLDYLNAQRAAQGLQPATLGETLTAKVGKVSQGTNSVTVKFEDIEIPTGGTSDSHLGGY